MRPLLAVAPLAVLVLCACRTTDSTPMRDFRFVYTTTISDFPADAKRARIWLPLPTTDEAQSVSDIEIDAPVEHRLGTEAVYRNRLVYLEVGAPFPERLPVTLSMRVARREVTAVSRLPGSPDAGRLLAGDRFAPLSDEARARAGEATANRETASSRARGIYDRVLADVSYDKSGEGWGRGSLEYVCGAGKGNCSDFHTLFVAMARSADIPAVFEIGFPLPRDRTEGPIGGYHCWAWYRDDDARWRPVDVSEADKDPSRTDYFFGTICQNRLAFSRGRDLILDPPQDGEPVNFHIYPYVEVDGESGVASVENSFRFREL